MWYDFQLDSCLLEPKNEVPNDVGRTVVTDRISTTLADKNISTVLDVHLTNLLVLMLIFITTNVQAF